MWVWFLRMLDNWPWMCMFKELVFPHSSSKLSDSWDRKHEISHSECSLSWLLSISEEPNVTRFFLIGPHMWVKLLAEVRDSLWWGKIIRVVAVDVSPTGLGGSGSVNQNYISIPSPSHGQTIGEHQHSLLMRLTASCQTIPVPLRLGVACSVPPGIM